MLGYGEIFTIFFVTLGPLKVLGPFAQRTHGLDDTAVRRIAVRAFLIATVAIVVGALAGRALADNWNISIAAMVITAGIIFFLVAIRQILDQYEATSHPPPEPLPAAPMAAALRVVFPAVLTPYGIAAAIAMVSATRDLQRIEMIIALLVIVMALNLVAMRFARRIMSGVTILVLQILGAVLGVLQAALAVQVVLDGLLRLGVLPK